MSGGAQDDELFEEILLCARYGELEDLQEYFTKMPVEQVSRMLKQQDARGNTALHFCAANGHLEVVKLLSSKETAALDLQNEGGNTALHWACLNGHLETVKYLVDDQGANVKIKNRGGRLPIDEAESQGKESIVLWLLALDMRREKEAGEAEEPDVEGEANVKLTAGDISETDEEANESVAGDGASQHAEATRKLDKMNMLD